MLNNDTIPIRLAVEADIPMLLSLMRGLAEFEQYADTFAVTEEVLRERGFRTAPPDFYALVADGQNGLLGMVVFYIVPFTAEAVPALYIKELFVTPEARGRRIGEALMRGAAREAVARGCGRVRWQVADWNREGKRFYERLGAHADPVWVNYALTPEAVAALANDDPEWGGRT
jgi:ribosomal protein S18 acetylase RimI-like enzyme